MADYYHQAYSIRVFQNQQNVLKYFWLADYPLQIFTPALVDKFTDTYFRKLRCDQETNFTAPRAVDKFSGFSFQSSFNRPLQANSYVRFVFRNRSISYNTIIPFKRPTNRVSYVLMSHIILLWSQHFQLVVLTKVVLQRYCEGRILTQFKLLKHVLLTNLILSNKEISIIYN